MASESSLFKNNLEMRAVKLALSNFDIPSEVPHPCCLTQHYCCGIHQQGRGDKILVPLEGNRIFILAGDLMQLVHPWKIHTSQDKCDGWRPPLSGSDIYHRVVTPPGHCQPHISTIGASHSRPLCVKVQHQVCNFMSPTPESRALSTDALAMS